MINLKIPFAGIKNIAQIEIKVHEAPTADDLEQLHKFVGQYFSVLTPKVARIISMIIQEKQKQKYHRKNIFLERQKNDQ